ncbi:MAG: alpha/beta hydrolase [Holdemanella sp.]|nr:alpha/beta hydrolase [Holdemanella sp.]
MLSINKRPVLFTVHGFGRRLSDEFTPLQAYFKKRHYKVVTFNMYDIYNDEDIHYKDWIERAEQKLKETLELNQPVIILGFSMGGVIASYLASIYPVQSLILVAPAFQYLDLPKATAHGVKFVKEIGHKDKDDISSQRTKAFTKIVSKYKESIAAVDCPVLILHGLNDEVIPLDSSRNAYEKITGKKFMMFIADGKHRMLYDNTIQDSLFPIIELWIKDKLI